MGNLHRCEARVKIEIETWNLRDIFFLYISKHMSPCQRKNSKMPKIRTTQNKDHPNIYILYKLSVTSHGVNTRLGRENSFRCLTTRTSRFSLWFNNSATLGKTKSFHYCNRAWKVFFLLFFSKYLKNCSKYFDILIYIYTQ